MTAVACCSVSDEFIPPFTLLKGVRCREIYKQELPQDLQSQWPIGVLLIAAFFSNNFTIFRSSSLKESVCWSWLVILYIPRICADRLAWKCSSCLLTGHVLQHFYRTVFKPIKAYYHQDTTKLIYNNFNVTITKFGFGKLSSITRKKHIIWKGCQSFWVYSRIFF